METHIIKPQLKARNRKDSCVSALAGCVQWLLLFGLPCGIAYSLTQSLVVGLSVYIAVNLLLLLFSVTSLEANVSGLRFKRILGSPKFLRWEEITSVTEVGRREVVLQGWLWPLFPSRETTPSLSSLHHYRIQWGSKHAYYPPQNPQEFEEIVRTYLHSSLPKGSA